MTITIAWVRRNKDTSELIVASDSRLRSRGAMDQAQKIFKLERGDCCLGFSGDAQIAYPLFVQVSSALNNFIRTRTRAKDVVDVAENIEKIINNIGESWDLSKKEKEEDLSLTNILFAGWSWKCKRFDIGIFEYQDGSFSFHHKKARLSHPWKEKEKSLVFIGDYREEYMQELISILENRFGKQSRNTPKLINFNYEPIEALQKLLIKASENKDFPAIGGAPQMIKIYSYGSSLPIVIRTEKDSHYLLGRRLFDWEKTEYPILDLTKDEPFFIYPMSHIPEPDKLKGMPGKDENEI